MATVIADGSNDSGSLAFYQQNGYMIVEDLFSPALCERAIVAAHDLPEARNGNLLTAMQPHDVDRTFYDLLRHPPLRTRIEAIIGPPIVGLATQFYYCPPGSSGLMRHQDNYCVEAPIEQFASCWIPLVDVDESNGCLILYPGSHREGMLPVRELAEHELRETYKNMREETALPASAVGLPLPAKRGTGVFLHAALVHESGPNRTQDLRYAFLGTYMRKGASFRAGNTAKRREIDLDSWSPA